MCIIFNAQWLQKSLYQIEKLMKEGKNDVGRVGDANFLNNFLGHHSLKAVKFLDTFLYCVLSNAALNY